MQSKGEQRSEGWGYIAGAASTAVAWGMLAALGHDVNPGILVGSFGVGIWKVVMSGR